MFWFKSVVGALLMPLPLALVCGGLGWGTLRSGRSRQIGRNLVALALAILLLAGNKWFSGLLVHPLESAYPAVPDLRPGAPLPPALAACRFVVVLGGGHDDAPDLPALSRLSGSARARLVEGVRILRLLPAATLVVSGPPTRPGGPPEAKVYAEAAVSLGVHADRIKLIETARDTEEEAAALRARLGTASFALVTSAWHLPRAMALCQGQGLRPFPCPADYLYTRGGRWDLEDFTWDVPSLHRTTVAEHEYLGLVWSWMRGRL